MSQVRTSGFFEYFYNIHKKIPSDILGGSPIEKLYLMAYLADVFNLKTYVEIGVYRGKSFVPMAAAFARNAGRSIGIDPYCLDEAMEFDLADEIKEIVQTFLKSLDFEKLYEEAIKLCSDVEFSNQIEIIRDSASKVIHAFKDTKISIDMLHVDGNHDYKKVKEDLTNYLPLICDGGFIVVDDINWKSVRAAYNEIKSEFIAIIETETFAILWKTKKSTTHLSRASALTKKMTLLFGKLRKQDFLKNKELNKNTLVKVGVLTYNHEKYIEQCLDSICQQNGVFKVKVIICDDCSTDDTARIIEQYIASHQNQAQFDFVFVKNKTNIGVFKNFHKLVQLVGECDYLTFCEGDDYWIDAHRIIEHIRFLDRNPECSLSFNMLKFFNEDSQTYASYETHKNFLDRIVETPKLIIENFIGNLGVGFYDANHIKKIPSDYFLLPSGDWFFNIFYSTFGDIGYIKKYMSAYRKHSTSFWSSSSDFDKARRLIRYVDEYNAFLDFDYDNEFTDYRNACLTYSNRQYTENVDLLIIDDIFPHPLSGFRYQEFKSYYEHIDSLKIISNGFSAKVLGSETIDDLIIDFKKLNKKVNEKLNKFIHWHPLDFKVLYFVFLGNAYQYLELAENLKKPFVFELYPGGSFFLKNDESDYKLRKVMSSSFFSKVIVTQKITYDYLIKYNFCPASKIEFIFGVVVPLDKLNSFFIKRRFGFDKKTLDICFMAHKYTPHGEDKGFDVFVNVAHILCRQFNNIFFHIIGPFDEHVIDVSLIKYRIKFYGTLSQESLDDFFVDKDIILSPNKSGLIRQGSFDGFPTASCTDAGLRGVAIFCTDEFGSNEDYFEEDKEIVVISYDSYQIAEKIKYFYKRPELLKNIGDRGELRIKNLYCFEKQLAPRISLLKKEIEASDSFIPFVIPQSNGNKFLMLSKIKIKQIIKRILPPFFRRVVRKALTYLRGL